MGQYTINSTPEQDAALAWIAGEGKPEEYLQARNNEILDSYVRGHNLDKVPVPTIDVATAYAYGTPEQQAAVVSTLGLNDPAALESTAQNRVTL